MLQLIVTGVRRVWARLRLAGVKTGPIEEETVVACSPTDWYPVMVGEVFLDQYEVLGKLGWGQTSTVWFCKDLEDDDYKVLKMCIHERGQTSREEKAYDAMIDMETDNIGVCFLRLHEDEFDVTGPSGYKHHGFIFAPAACNVAQVMRALNGPIHPAMVKIIMRHTLEALDFLHEDVRCVHTDVKANNILFTLNSRKVLEDFAQYLEDHPPKSRGSRERGTLVYESSHFRNHGKEGWSSPILSDLGEAHLLGNEHDLEPAPVGPVSYRPPETVLGMRWSYPLDIWQAACMFYNLLTYEQLFDMPPGKNQWSVSAHLAQMVALMGPPPADFLSRSDVCQTYFDHMRAWNGYERYCVPDGTLEDKFDGAGGEERDVMVDFIRGMLTWKPEDRKTAKELLQHPYLRAVEASSPDAESSGGRDAA